MAENTKIEWTDHTFNPWWGCTHVHEGCRNCYAETWAKRFGVKWGPGGVRRLSSESVWKQPLKWNRAAQKSGIRTKVFCSSMADVFENWKGPLVDSEGREMWVSPQEPNRFCPHRDGEMMDFELENIAKGQYRVATMDDVRRKLFWLIDSTPFLDWQLLTKRPENIRRMWVSRVELQTDLDEVDYRSNVWLGTSISDQESADKQLPHLLATRDLSPIRFISAEPLLGFIEFPLPCQNSVFWSGINWVIVGGESGNEVRAMRPDWARSLRDQCVSGGVSFLFKQWGEFSPDRPLPGMPLDDPSGMIRVGKAAAGRVLDGREWNEFPEPVSK